MDAKLAYEFIDGFFQLVQEISNRTYWKDP